MQGFNKISIASFLILVPVLFCSCGSDSEETAVQTGWKDDIAWISDTLPLLHYDLFLYQPRESLDVRLDRLEERLDGLGDMETAMELTRVLASMGCSHTGITFWDRCEIRAYPISVMWLDAGLFVTAIDSSRADLIGSRLLEYDGRPAEMAAEAMGSMFPATNDVVIRTNAERFMMLASCMSALGFGDLEEPTDFTFLKEDGDTVLLQFAPVDFTYTDMVDFHFAPGIQLPVWLSSDDCYWFEYLSDRKMLYCAYNSCSTMQGYPVQQFVEEMDRMLGSSEVTDLVIDLRRNGGGNSLVAEPIISWLEELSEAEGPRISLIIGRWTYSSGILNALEIAAIPGVTVYGENTGGAPNHLGEVMTAVLPYSGLTVSYPTKYFQTVEGPGRTMMPDYTIPLGPDMLFHGSNDILDTISSHTRLGVVTSVNE